MKIKSIEFLTMFATRLAEGSCGIVELCKRISIEGDRPVSWSSIYEYMRDPNIILPEFMGEKNLTFKKAMNMARKCATVSIISQSLEERVLNGTLEEVFHHGQPTWVEDEELVLFGEKFALDVLGMPDMYKRDADGNRIVRTRRVPAPAQLVAEFARANMPGVYGTRSEVTMRGQVNLGVTVLGRDGARHNSELIAKPILGRVIEQDVVETMLLELPEPVETYVPIEPEPEPVPVPPVAPVAVAFDDAPRRPARSPLEQSLYNALDEAKAKSRKVIK
jgi:hypothetical protein